MEKYNNSLKKEILFICYFGKQRSPTAKDVFNKLIQQDNNLKKEYYASYASLLFNSRLNQKKIEDSYKVIALTKGLKKRLKKKYFNNLENEKLKCLNIGILNRNGSKKLVKRIEEYFYSKEWK